MANVCQVYVRGWMPYNITSRSERCCIQLGMLNTPCTGLKIEYGAGRYVPTEREGLYAHYQFVIRGKEAVWYSALKKMIGDFVDGGCFIEEARMMDLEFDQDNMHWEEIEIKGGKKTPLLKYYGHGTPQDPAPYPLSGFFSFGGKKGEKKIEGLKPGTLLARGSFAGLEEGEGFAVKIVGDYSTVVSGRVKEFVLQYPRGYEVDRKDVSLLDAPMVSMYRFTVGEEERYFRLMRGDAMNLAELEVSTKDEWEHFYERWGDC